MLQECYFCMQIYQNWYICMQYIPDVVYLRYANHNELRDPIYMSRCTLLELIKMLRSLKGSMGDFKVFFGPFFQIQAFRPFLGISGG